MSIHSICADCGSQHTHPVIEIIMNGLPWYLWDDGYRFWIKPVEVSSIINKDKRVVFEYKHFDIPAELPELIMAGLEALAAKQTKVDG